MGQRGRPVSHVAAVPGALAPCKHPCQRLLKAMDPNPPPLGGGGCQPSSYPEASRQSSPLPPALFPPFPTFLPLFVMNGSSKGPRIRLKRPRSLFCGDALHSLFSSHPNYLETFTQGPDSMLSDFRTGVASQVTSEAYIL